MKNVIFLLFAIQLIIACKSPQKREILQYRAYSFNKSPIQELSFSDTLFESNNMPSVKSALKHIYESMREYEILQSIDGEHYYINYSLKDTSTSYSNMSYWGKTQTRLTKIKSFVLNNKKIVVYRFIESNLKNDIYFSTYYSKEYGFFFFCHFNEDGTEYIKFSGNSQIDDLVRSIKKNHAFYLEHITSNPVLPTEDFLP